MAERIAAHEWCWACGERRGGPDHFVHRADNPVLAHGRCGVCNDVLMPYPQPRLAEKLTQLGTHLQEATKWSRSVTADAPNDDQDLALGEIRELLLQAHRVYMLRLESPGAPRAGSGDAELREVGQQVARD